MENNKFLNELLQQLEDPTAEGTALQALAGDGEGFGADFAERVTAAAYAEPGPGMGFYLPRMFRWVALAGAAAAITLLILTWYSSEGLDADAVAGISELSIEDVFAENLF